VARPTSPKITARRSCAVTGTPIKNPRSAKRNVIPSSRGVHDRADRIHNDLWLIDDHNVTGLFGNDLTSAFRKRDLITLQVSPCRIGASRTGHHHHRNRELSARSPDFRRALANMDDFVCGRLVSGGTEACCARESLRGRRQ
jgi:hypothetical protein